MICDSKWRYTLNFLTIAFLIQSANSIAAIRGSSQTLPIHYGGRVLVNEINHTFTYSWPGIYFEASFTGSELDIKLDDANNILNIIVDNNETAVLNKPGKITYSLTKLGTGKHTVRLEKRTETQQGTGTFEGFYIPSKNKIFPPTTRIRKMEFIGDSMTVGYGNTSTSHDCNDQKIFSSTNTQLAFGPITAKYFNADYQINASSGFGVVRNYNGGYPNESLIKLYPFTLNDHGISYKDNWSPQIIVVGLGTNDFSTPLNNGEKWKNREELASDFEKTYEQFLLTLRNQHKQAFIVVGAPTEITNEITIHVNQIIKNIKANGDKKIEMLTFPPLELTGCQWHPSQKDDLAISEQLIQYINSHPDLWK